MGNIHLIKVVPDSEAEKCLMKIMNEVDVKRKSLHCRLGEIFGKPYNEYIISDGLFKLIQEKIEKEGLRDF